MGVLKVSYSDVFGIRYERDDPESVVVGDTVVTGDNASPTFTVVAINDGKVWLRSRDGGVDAIVPLSRCRKV